MHRRANLSSYGSLVHLSLIWGTSKVLHPFPEGSRQPSYSLVIMCISPGSTVIFPKSETAMLSSLICIRTLLTITEWFCWNLFTSFNVPEGHNGHDAAKTRVLKFSEKKNERFWWEPWILLPLTGRLRSSLQSHDKPCDQESLCTATSASCPGGCPGPPTWKSTTCSQSFLKSPTCPRSTGSRTTLHRPISPS